jgi:hypothetical protein
MSSWRAGFAMKSLKPASRALFLARSAFAHERDERRPLAGGNFAKPRCKHKTRHLGQSEIETDDIRIKASAISIASDPL